MQIVIDIPEQIYLNAKADTLCGSDILVKAIKNGILHESVTEFADRCRECGREKVLDKISAEIEQINDTMGVSYNLYVSKIDVLQIIDKYKVESEDKD